jgi:lipopolysaccharide/colanic/teichoic acid biosynthesis glycosyltransferase
MIAEDTVLTADHSPISTQRKSKPNLILFVGINGVEICEELLKYNFTGLSISSPEKAYYWLENLLLQGKELPEAIFCDFELESGGAFYLHHKVVNNDLLKGVPFIILAKNADIEDKKRALKIGVDDFYEGELSISDILHRIKFIKQFKVEKERFSPEPQINMNYLLPVFKMPFLKRLFDIVTSLTTLILLSPLFLLIAVLIKIESRGPIFYISKRAGTGYQIFDFYKFRSMRPDADKLLAKMKEKNQYGDSAFVKIGNDPRVTRIGKILRNTSIDELPQLFNVLKGDMSIVGNRPLPLYEAELLTKDQWAKRFLAPAGITGLWQVTKRGRAEMSEEERMELDIAYADKSSFWFDMGIILRTVPALFQKENV